MNINLDNYEQWMIAYLDKELSAIEIKEFNLFVESNPSVKSEFEAYSSMQLSADEEIIFEDKEILLKKESDFILWKTVWPIAAAVLLALVVIPFLRDSEAVEPKVAINTVEPIKETAPSIKKSTKTNKALIHEEEATPTTEKKQVTQPVQAQAAKHFIAKKKTPVKKRKKDYSPKTKEIIDVPLQEVIVVKEKPKNEPVPKVYLKELQEQEKTENAVASIPTNKNEPTDEKSHALITISADKNPIIHDKLNEAVAKVENKIEQLKEFKKSPITVSIGKLKLFTLNN